MNHPLPALALALLLLAAPACRSADGPGDASAGEPAYTPRYVFAVDGETTLLNGEPILLKGLRLSNALISDAAVEEAVAHLDTFAAYGVNAFSVYLQGSRFGDVKGYRADATLDPTYTTRLARLIEAADAKGFVVLVGCLYWGNSRGKWDDWTQEDANAAVANLVRWLSEHNYRNVFVDVDNEGMAQRDKGFDPRALVQAGKQVDSTILIATNFRGPPPPEADLAIHFSEHAGGTPYLETEGSAPEAPGGYWGSYSKQGAQWSNGPDLYQYIRIGVYTDAMKQAQIAATFRHLDAGEGYFMASTWLQAVPPEGPNHRPGGYGAEEDPGIRWWLEAVRDQTGSYTPPSPLR